MIKKQVKRYSQAFKQQVVREYEAGESVKRLRERYRIGGTNTVKEWVEKYGREGWRSEMVIIQGVEDQEKEKEMKKRIVALERALAQSVLDKVMLETIVEVAGKELKMDLKKSFGTR